MRLWQSRKCCSEYSEQTFGMMRNSRISISSVQESRSLQSEIDTIKNADAVNSLCTVNTVHGLRDCRNNGKSIQCLISLTFS